jgi:hypothetical protein
MNSEITEAMFSAWKTDPVTGAMAKALIDRRTFHTESLAKGAHFDFENYAVRVARNVGAIDVIDAILNTTYNEFVGKEEGEEND